MHSGINLGCQARLDLLVPQLICIAFGQQIGDPLVCRACRRSHVLKLGTKFAFTGAKGGRHFSFHGQFGARYGLSFL